MIGPVEVSRDRRTLWWTQPQEVHLEFERPVRSWIRALDGNSLLIVEEAPPLEDNLVRRAGDGMVVWRSGSRDPRAVTIDQLLIEDSEVVAIEITNGGDFRSTIDLLTGELSRIGPWR